jgi:hypothetical protein
MAVVSLPEQPKNLAGERRIKIKNLKTKFKLEITALL